MLRGGRHARRLDAPHVGDAKARGEEGVLPVGFLGASPARVAGQVEVRGEDLPDSHGAGLGADGFRDLPDKLLVEGRAQRDGLRKDRAPLVAQAMQRLADHEEGNAEARFPEEVLLDGVEPLEGGLVGRLVRRAPSVAAPHRCGRVRVEAADKAHLHDFLAEGHPRKQILDARLHGRGRIPVEGLGLRNGCGRGHLHSKSISWPPGAGNGRKRHDMDECAK